MCSVEWWHCRPICTRQDCRACLSTAARPPTRSDVVLRAICKHAVDCCIWLNLNFFTKRHATRVIYRLTVQAMPDGLETQFTPADTIQTEPSQSPPGPLLLAAGRSGLVVSAPDWCDDPGAGLDQNIWEPDPFLPLLPPLPVPFPSPSLYIPLPLELSCLIWRAVWIGHLAVVLVTRSSELGRQKICHQPATRDITTSAQTDRVRERSRCHWQIQWPTQGTNLLSGTHYRKLFSVVTLLLFLSLG